MPVVNTGLIREDLLSARPHYTALAYCGGDNKSTSVTENLNELECAVMGGNCYD
jgi:hypothetical protein